MFVKIFTSDLQTSSNIILDIITKNQYEGSIKTTKINELRNFISNIYKEIIEKYIYYIIVGLYDFTLLMWYISIRLNLGKLQNSFQIRVIMHAFSNYYRCLLRIITVLSIGYIQTKYRYQIKLIGIICMYWNVML